MRKNPYLLPLHILAFAMLCAVALMMTAPFLWMLLTSLKTQQEAFQFPPSLLPARPVWENYTQLFTLVPFGRYFLNTLVVTVAVVIGQLFVCSLAAYAFARLNFMGRDTLFVLYLATMMVPFQVTLIPLYLLVFQLGWVNTYWGLIAPGLSSAYGIFLLRQAFLTVPQELIDAARIDGASEFTIYSRVFLPMNGPSLATLGVFAFLGTWTDLLWPLLIVRNPQMRTLELGLAYFQSAVPQFVQPNWPLLMAAAVVVMLPVIVVYLMAQRYFVEGIALGSVKG
ncbi:MAG TPA: carbohydrate ABC transporter permease [Meiothermus sp.]|jgi:multiple sugar transport system permease protein|nr:carbohydrate ABC transporter permease [Meiothermus sp.]